MSKKENKERRHLSYRARWVITLIMLMIALALVISCINQGLFAFKPGAVTANDDDIVADTDTESDDGEAAPLYDEYSVFISEGNGGTANPSGKVSVDAWGSITVSFTPNDGYEIQSVVVDGEDKGAINSYTLSYITSDHTIMVTFDKLVSATPEPTD